MAIDSVLNNLTETLAPYPMEELNKVKQNLKKQNIEILDFGTGDPLIPVWPKLLEATCNALEPISQYPSVHGSEPLRNAQESYMKRRFNLDKNANWATLPSKGSKEAIFHIGLSVVGRKGKRRVLYPDPGYPVYRSSTLFAGGIPTPVALKAKDGYLLKPWELDKEVQRHAAAVWVNYPHNPTGFCADKAYYSRLLDWCQDVDCLLLSDECYSDIYDQASEKSGDVPETPLTQSTEGVISFYSLSKRSGLTGHRAGFMAGDAKLLTKHAGARANFGVAMPTFTQKAAALAWSDDAHVKERRVIFNERMQLVGQYLKDVKLIDEIPKATFYLWAKVPPSYGERDIDFCLDLAKTGMIASPSSWLSEEIRGYFRLALVPDLKDCKRALERFAGFLK